MSLFRNLRGSVYGNTTQSLAVQRFATYGGLMHPSNRAPFVHANQSILGAEKLFKTRPGQSGIKDSFTESKINHRLVGRDAMLRALEAKRENEDNPLLKSIETKPVKFSKEDVKIVEREAMDMDTDVKNARTVFQMPIAESKIKNIGNTKPTEAKHYIREFTVPTNFSDLQTLETKKEEVKGDMAPGVRKRRANVIAPALADNNKRVRGNLTVNHESLIGKTNAKLYCRQNM